MVFFFFFFMTNICRTKTQNVYRKTAKWNSFWFRLTTNFDENQNLTNSHHCNHNWPFDETKCFESIIYERAPNIGRYSFPSNLRHTTGLSILLCERETFKRLPANRRFDAIVLICLTQKKTVWKTSVATTMSKLNWDDFCWNVSLRFCGVLKIRKSSSRKWFYWKSLVKKSILIENCLFKNGRLFDITSMFIQHYLKSTYQRV